MDSDLNPLPTFAPRKVNPSELMSSTIRIRKGADIRLKGRASSIVENAPASSKHAILPEDFHGVIPKMEVRQGDLVQAGQVLFHDKYKPEVHYLSPVSGKVSDIVRGAKRRILAIEIEADGQDSRKTFDVPKLSSASREELVTLLSTGGWFGFIRQRPFDVPADPGVTPRSIHISGFNSAPLAPETAVVMDGRMEDFQTGIEVLGKLAGNGGVHLGVKAGDSTFDSVSGVNKATFDGPHPAGNVGVQIHHTFPINAGEVVWTMNYEDVANLGAFIRTGTFAPERVIAACGSQHADPKHYKIRLGAQVGSVLAGTAVDDNVRVISGDALTGRRVTADGYIGAFAQQVTVMPEGNKPKFLLTEGWLSPGLDKFSLSRAYPTWLMPKTKEYDLDTNSNGEPRAFVVTGQYEQVFPFDIYPVQLLKSIMVNDIEAMEKLGIYEVAPEDFALCEYSCTSKINVQQVVREGLDTLKQELG
jgi:Na+-transporting NADH:ubiquinone oxidoreductase subunit A